MSGISTFIKLAPKFFVIATALRLYPDVLKEIEKENNQSKGLKHAFEAWLSGKSSLPPTWGTLLNMLRSIKMEDLADDIYKNFFSEAQKVSRYIHSYRHTYIYTYLHTRTLLIFLPRRRSCLIIRR